MKVGFITIIGVNEDLYWQSEFIIDKFIVVVHGVTPLGWGDFRSYNDIEREFYNPIDNEGFMNDNKGYIHDKLPSLLW
jgi:hypothetical protein